MNEEIMNEIQPVRPKDQFTFSCRQCGACCRNIEGCVMVESLDAYRLARYLRAKGEPIEGIEDFLFRYCEPEPLTEEGFPIYMLKTKAPNSSCIFLTDGRCSVYPARTRTCRIYPLTVGPGERGRDFEYCLCLDRHQSHFTGSRVSVKDWLYQNFKREDKEYVKREYEIATELGKLIQPVLDGYPAAGKDVYKRQEQGTVLQEQFSFFLVLDTAQAMQTGLCALHSIVDLRVVKPYGILYGYMEMGMLLKA